MHAATSSDLLHRWRFRGRAAPRKAFYSIAAPTKVSVRSLSQTAVSNSPSRFVRLRHLLRRSPNRSDSKLRCQTSIIEFSPPVHCHFTTRLGKQLELADAGGPRTRIGLLGKWLWGGKEHAEVPCNDFSTGRRNGACDDTSMRGWRSARRARVGYFYLRRRNRRRSYRLVCVGWTE